jgi:hypothetical protein
MLLHSLVSTVHAAPQTELSDLTDSKHSLSASAPQDAISEIAENPHKAHFSDTEQMSCLTHEADNQSSCCQNFCYSGFCPSLASATSFFGGKAKHQFAEQQLLLAFHPNALNRPPRI